MIKKIIPIMVLAVLCLNFKANGQSQISAIKPLKVGDRLPESFWQQEHTVYANGKTTTQTLAAYKSKLLILDFWATWCGSCIKKFSLLDSLQQNHSEVKVMLVNTLSTKDTLEKVRVTMTEYGRNLQTVVSDAFITKLFPQAQLPLYVWIAQGQVRAITGGEFLTKENVASAVQRRQHLNQTIEKRKFKKP